MKHFGRNCPPSILIHCYQRSLDGRIIFYNVRDRLVYFTLFCVIADRYDVRVLKLCLMPDHVHMVVTVDRPETLSDFVRDLSSSFARRYNALCGRKGELFDSPFGSAPKIGDKKARTCLTYVDNNPVERRLCRYAEQYRWNFIAYSQDPAPFSKPIRRRHCSRPLLRAIDVTDFRHKEHKYLSYRELCRIMEPLKKEEIEQLTDYIISKYSILDYSAGERFFGGYHEMISAAHNNTGSEYDLNEVFVGRTDAVYSQMSNILLTDFGFKDIHEITVLPIERKVEIMRYMSGRVSATAVQFAKYLHLPSVFK